MEDVSLGQQLAVLAGAAPPGPPRQALEVNVHPQLRAVFNVLAADRRRLQLDFTRQEGRDGHLADLLLKSIEEVRSNMGVVNLGSRGLRTCCQRANSLR